MTEPIKWHKPEDSNQFLTFEDIDKMRKSYNPTEFRRQYLNEPDPSEPARQLFDKSAEYARQFTNIQKYRNND